MRFSLWPTPGRSTDEILDLARFADANDWYGFWFADHYMPNTGTADVNDGDTHECWSVLPAVSVATERVRLGPLVAPTSVHHPALLANRAATIDHLSNGRMVLGLGAGWQINEHTAYGIDLEAPGPRVSRFEEAIQVVRSLLDDERTSFTGDFYEIQDAPCNPKPVQSHLPILVGTGGSRMCRITARHADEWNTWGAPDLAADRRQVWTRACEAAGVDPDDKHTSAQAMVHMTDGQGVVDKIAEGPMADRSIAGSNEQIIDGIGHLEQLGFDEFIVLDASMGATAEARREAFERFQAEIMPAFA